MSSNALVSEAAAKTVTSCAAAAAAAIASARAPAARERRRNRTRSRTAMRTLSRRRRTRSILSNITGHGNSGGPAPGFGSGLRRASAGDARDPREVRPARDAGITVDAEQAAAPLGLVEPVLEEEPAARHQVRLRAADDRADRVEPVGPGDE